MGWMSAIVTPTKRWALNYYITQSSLEIRLVGNQTSWREDVGMRTCPREAGPPGPRLSSPGERERNVVMANRVRVNMLQFCPVSNSLSHTTLSNKVRGIFFQELYRSSIIVVLLWLCMHLHMSIQQYLTWVILFIKYSYLIRIICTQLHGFK